MTPIRGIVRDARATDVDVLIEVARRSWLSAFARTAPFELIAQWMRADREASWYQTHWSEMLVFEQQGGVWGLVQPRGAEINGLWVHPDWQGCGVGTWLLSSGEDRIRRAGHRAAWLTCSGFNRRALEFYRRRGYAETARTRERHPCGVCEESIRLERQLAGPLRGIPAGIFRNPAPG